MLAGRYHSPTPQRHTLVHWTTQLSVLDLAKFRQRAFDLLCRPEPIYPYRDVVQDGVWIGQGYLKKLYVLECNAFRDHRAAGALRPIRAYLAARRADIVRELLKATRADVDHLSDTIRNEWLDPTCSHLPNRVFWTPYNRLRKLIDVSLLHIVALTPEFTDSDRERIVPHLFQPIDRVIMQAAVVFALDGQHSERVYPFTLADLKAVDQNLRRGSTYGEITTREDYLALQDLTLARANELTTWLREPFFPVYFDLIWGARFQHPTGHNLFTASH